MPVLLGNSLRAVLDLEDLAAARIRVKYHHVKLTHGKLQDEHLLSGVRHPGFKQNDVLKHPSSDFGQNALLNGGSLRQGQRAEGLISASACA